MKTNLLRKNKTVFITVLMILGFVFSGKAQYLDPGAPDGAIVEPVLIEFKTVVGTATIRKWHSDHPLGGTVDINGYVYDFGSFNVTPAGNSLYANGGCKEFALMDGTESDINNIRANGQAVIPDGNITIAGVQYPTFRLPDAILSGQPWGKEDDAVNGVSGPKQATCEYTTDTEIGIGSGAYIDLLLEANTYYSFKWEKGYASINKGIIKDNSGNTLFTLDHGEELTEWLPGTNTTIRIWAERVGCTWQPGVGAKFSYKASSPTLTDNNPTSATICTGSPVTLQAGTVSPSGATIYWQNTNQNGTSTSVPISSSSVSSAGTYYYRANWNNCWSTPQETVVTPGIELITVDAGPDKEICAGESVVLNGEVSYPTPPTAPSYDCTPNYPSGVETINRVRFNAIDNTSSGGGVYEDFTSNSTDVLRESSYTLTVWGNTAGSFTNYIRVYIDWDRSGTFDGNEEYDLGTIYNTANGSVSTTITVPTGASVGETRMRVMKKFNGYDSGPCDLNGYGQAEDYTINILPPPVTYSWSGGPIVSGANTLTPTVNPTTTTTYTLTATAPGACPAKDNVIVTVKDLVMTGSFVVCAGESTDLDVIGETDWVSLATGGNTSTAVNGDKLHIFDPGTTTFVTEQAIKNVSYLIVGGGGGGGGSKGEGGSTNVLGSGGGGGGGFLQGEFATLGPSTNMPVIVGVGGIAGVEGTSGGQGGNSSINGTTAVGGGGGRSKGGVAPGDGGSGGGGRLDGTAFGNGTPGQGHNGGSFGDNSGGGGGGAGSAGGNGNGDIGGAGGTYLSNNITGPTINYARGGAGGGFGTANHGVDGTDGLGNGGSGAEGTPNDEPMKSGGKGGSGVVIIRYITPTWTVTNGTGTATIDELTGILTGLTPGTVNVTYTNSRGCSVQQEVIITEASDGPTASTGGGEYCHGNVITLTQSGGSTNPEVSDVWYAAAGETAPTATSCDNEGFMELWNQFEYQGTSCAYHHNGTDHSINNGKLELEVNGSDPWIWMYPLPGNATVNTNQYKYVNVRYKVNSYVTDPSTVLPEMRVFYTKETACKSTYNDYIGDYPFTGAESSMKPLNIDGAWHIASFPVHENALWNGTVTGFRLDYFDPSTQNANIGSTMEVDFMIVSEHPMIGEGTNITLSPGDEYYPTETTTYYAKKIDNCGATNCVSETVVLPVPGTDLALNNESATCVVNNGERVHFYHSSGRLIATVEATSGDLGITEATAYVDPAPQLTGACVDLSYVTSVMERHWVINPTIDAAASVYLPFYGVEFTDLVAAANSNSNPDDDLGGIGDLKLSKYKGPDNVNENWQDNCISHGGNETTTIHSIDGNGDVTIANNFMKPIGTAQFARYDIPDFSEFWLHGQQFNSPLPVTLTSLSATCDKQVTLNWTTESEQNSDRFVIEKSRDGLTWTYVGEQSGAGNSNATIDYNHIDENTWSGISYYRLVQKDFNGDEEIYGPISTFCEESGSSLAVYPNPNDGTFTIEILSDKAHSDAHIYLTDATGKLIASQKVDVAVGTTQVMIDQFDLSRGVYMLTLRGGGLQLKPVKVIVN